ncbi:alpha/beta hydrolase [Verrucomicrobiales bacterium BCK34]|nr:alpha/beta hydrolase [Verrucomicrobiales bacterium BCK34]
MKFIPLASLLIFTCAGSFAAERVPLWPEGKTPYSKPIDKETGSPSIEVYSTKGSGNHTGAAVVICPGGGYGGLAKDHEGHQPAQWFNEQGVSAFVLQYRLGSQGHHYPTELADVQRAIRWVRSQAGEFDLATDRIAVMGFSAGGHLASMAATLYDEKAYEASDAIDEVSARPDFAILCYPVISMDSDITHKGSRNNLLGPDKATDDDFAAKLSSEKNVTAETPPTFLFQTNADTAVPAENATRFFLACREHGVPVEYHCYQNGPHGVGLYRGDPILGGWSDLLKNWLLVNSFYAEPKSQAAVSGKVSLDGEPVSWGVITFHPEDENQPVTSVRVRRGSFSAKPEEGPVLGKSTLTFEGSIWEATGNPEDKAVALRSLSPDSDAPITVAVSGEMKPLQFDFTSR